jgi:exonuclease SbcC
MLSKADLDNLRGQQGPLRQEMDTLRKRIDSLQEADEDSSCPTCGQPLTAEHRRSVLADLQQSGRQKGDQYRTNKERISTLEQEITKLEGAFQQKGRLERDQQAQQQRLAKAEARLAEIEQNEQEWQANGAVRLAALRRQHADQSALQAQAALVQSFQEALDPRAALASAYQSLQNELSTSRATSRQMEQQIDAWQTRGQNDLQQVRRQLEQQDYALQATSALKTLENEANKVGYDAGAHQAAVDRRASLSTAPSRFQKLKQAEAAMRPLDASIAELKQRAGALAQELSQQAEQLQTAEKSLQLLVDESGDLREIEAAVTALREEEIDAVSAAGVAQQKVNVLLDLQQQKDDLQEKRVAVTERIRRFKFLEKSCGRQGVQALLIEHALPDIEERANQLIERLSGGAMQIYFDTQRKLKTKDALAETLDIRIEDKDGVRPYDNYSGGEQFRVNFAIRLALSQLLAHRAGARLQTLVIDEGFGSQDPQGRQRLVEAINAVRDEFACILVITHIAELRDAFSTRIEIQKTTAGSVIHVV